MSTGGLRGILRDAELRHERAAPAREVNTLLASEEANRSLRKAARMSAAGFPMEIDEAARRQLSPVAVKASGKAGEFWRLEPNETAMLLAMSPAEYDAARKSPERALLGPEQFYRAGLLIEIFLTLVQIFNGKLAYEWPRRANNGALFGGRSPIELMQAGGTESMSNVLGHLFALAGGLQLDLMELDRNEQ